jgi:AcrR family transcriptional regulator
LTRDDLMREAVAIVDADGFEALSLRALAVRLGVTPMALYTYVQSKDELVDLTIAELVRETQARQAAQLPDDWEAALEHFARSNYELVRTHPTMVQAYQRLVHFSGARAISDEVISRLVTAGFTREDAASALAAVHMLALGLATIGSLEPDPARREEGEEERFDESLRLLIAGIRQQLPTTARRRASARSRR